MTLYKATADGNTPMTPEEETAFLAAQAAPAPVPSVVTMRQARLALLQAGLLGTVNSNIAEMSGAEGEAARITWEYAQTVDRNHALIAVIAPGLTDAEIDDLFRTAAAL